MRHSTSRASAGSKGYWSSLSDTELLARDTRAFDPEALQGLLERPPHGDEVPEIESDYDTRSTTGRKVRCAHCKVTAPNHNVGFVMRFADGRRMLIGNVCATEHYGVEFTSRRGEFERAVKRSELLKRRQAVIDCRRQVDQLLEEIEGDRCWSEYRELRRTFQKRFYDLYEDLGEAVRRRDGMLFALVQVEDEEAQQAYEKKHGRRVSIKKRAESVVHTLKGRPFFSIAGDDPKDVISACVRRAKAALWTLEDKAGSDRDLEDFFRGISKMFERMRVAAEDLKAPARAFAPDNIAGISRWLSLQSAAHGHLFLVDGRLYRAGKIDGPVRQHPGAVMGSATRHEMQVPARFRSAPADKIETAYKLLFASQSQLDDATRNASNRSTR